MRRNISLFLAAILIVGFAACEREISVTGVSLDRSALEITVGETERLIATVRPDNADDPSVTWSSSNTTVATVNASGVVTAVAAGTATITVTTVDGEHTATAIVTVPAVGVTGITLHRTSIGIGISTTGTFIATITPANATNQNIEWTSNNTSVATVVNGVVTAVSEGRATITATTIDGNFEATALVDVFPTEMVTDAGVEIGGVRWATRNVGMPGAFVDNPEHLGMLYQWNRPVGWTPGGLLINHEGGTTWSATPTTTSWYSQNNPCPEGWRVPTHSELQSLVNSGHTWTTNWSSTGVRGHLFGTAPNQVFLPVVGSRSVSGTPHFATAYWSETRGGTDWTNGAWVLSFVQFDGSVIRIANGLGSINGALSHGNSVRCVAR